MSQKTLLMILDGWGNAPDPNVSAVDQAKTPYIDSLYQNYSFNTLRTDGEHVGEVMLLSINYPIRIGAATVLPGDVVLAKKEGVLFIPAHLTEKVVLTSEIVRLRDLFGITRLKEGIYTPGQIDNKWSETIEKDFYNWLDIHKESLPVPKSQIETLLQKRTW